MSNFHIGEVCILNSFALKGLPSRIGEKAVITESYSSPNYDWIIEFDDGEEAPVKSSELTKLTTKDIELMNYIFTTNKVKCLEEEVTILTVDYLNGQAEVQFDDKSVTVVDFNKLIEIEDDTLPIFNFSNDKQNNKEDIYETFLNTYFDHYKNSNDTYEIPKQLLINLLKQSIELEG